MKTHLTKKQFVSILVIVILGAVLGWRILGMQAPRPGAETDAHGHADSTHAHAGSAGRSSGGEHEVEEEHGHDHDENHRQEGVIALDDEQIAAAGIAIRAAGAARLRSTLRLPGEIRFNEDRTVHVVPRLSGSVESVRVKLGEKVAKGQVLAVLASSVLSEQRSELLTAQKRLALARTTFAREKTLWEEKISAEQDYLQARQAMSEAEIAVRNASQKLRALGTDAGGAGGLNHYEIRAPIAGTVMSKHISLGEAVKEDADIFTISDLSTVWAEIAVPAKDLDAVRVGEKVTVRATAFEAQAEGEIAYVGALLGEQTRTAKAHAVLPNPDLAWRPGLFVNVEIVSGDTQVPVAVSADAIHGAGGQATVFLRVPGGFQARSVTPGRSDGKTVEVVEGLADGAEYAGEGSFIIRSEQGKASAEHTH